MCGWQTKYDILDKSMNLKRKHIIVYVWTLIAILLSPWFADRGRELIVCLTPGTVDDVVGVPAMMEPAALQPIPQHLVDQHLMYLEA